MEKMEAIYVFLLSALLISSWVPTSYSAKKSKEPPVARLEDMPYIKCQVCEKMATQLYQQVKKKEAQISPKKISELQIIGISENLCDLKKQQSDWILKIDIVENGDKLELVDQDDEGQCDTECKTIQRTCLEVMGYFDIDIAEYMFKAKPKIDVLVNYLCHDLTKACSTKPPPVPKDRVPGEPFTPKSAKDAEMEKLMKSMEGMPGAPGMKMYSKEDLLDGNFGDEEDDEDDEDNEENFPSKAGKVLKGKETRKGSWKQKMTKVVANTGKTLKRYADKVSLKAQQWWRGKKVQDPKKSANAKLEL